MSTSLRLPAAIQNPSETVTIPQLRPIKVLHRHDGYISFMVRDGDELRPRFAIRATELDEIFPEFAVQLIRDSFVSINAGYTLADRSNAPTGRPLHRTEFLRYLCACYCDLDYYNLGLTRPQVVYRLERMWEAGELPCASMLIDSGRGMWILWMLHDGNRPSRAHLGAFTDNPYDHVQLYTKTNRALRARLDHLGADAIHDAARHIRVPGSFRNDTEEFVQWDIKGTAGSVNSYTLKGLAELVGVRTMPRPKAEQLALESTVRKPGAQSRAWKKTNENRLAALSILRDLRGGGFQEGIRNKAAVLYALALKAVNTPLPDLERTVLEMGAKCQPPLSDGECRRASKQAHKAKSVKMGYRTMADALEITPSEAEFITQVLYRNVRSGDRRFFPAASKFGDVQPVTTLTGGELRSTKRARREEAILRIVCESPSVPSIREMMRKLDALGTATSIGTLHKEYKRLGLASPIAVRRESALAFEQLRLSGSAIPS